MRDEFAYDELGRRYSTTSFAQISNQPGTRREVISTRTRYDLAGHVVAQIDNAGNETTSMYDAYGHKVAEMDGAGKSMTWKVDPFGRLTSHVDQGGAQIQYEYNGQGSLIHQWSTPRQGSGAQDISYIYENGLLSRIDDRGTGLVTQYKYDLAGNRVLERAVSTTAEGTVVAQNNQITYDQRGRMTHVEDDQFRVDIDYDNNGNRTHVTTNYVNSAGSAVYSEVWNTYDAMNREVIANGSMANGVPVMGANGHVITYDGNGRRGSDSYMYRNQNTGSMQQTTENFTYDDMGRLNTVTRDGVVVERRYYDEFGRVIQSGPQESANENALRGFGIAPEIRTYHYNAAGQVQRMKSWSLTGKFLDDIYYRTIPERVGGYDGAGNLLQYSVVHPGTKGDQHSVYTNAYTYFDSAKEIQVKGAIGSTVEFTSTTLDANGNAIKVTDTSAPGKDRTFINDAAGRVLISRQSNETVRMLIVNGEVLGSNSDEANPSGFANAYQSATTGANLASPSIYHVQGGETLKSIAKAVWGDANLWYLIANANNLEVDSALTAGQTLRLPARVNVVHNDADTFTPYNPSEAIGSTTPTLPLPAAGEGGCGGAGRILVVVVAIAVTILTQGATLNALGSTASWAFGAAAGSAASQGVAIATGQRESFSWGEVFTSAVGGAVTGSLPAAGGNWATAAKNAALSNAASQGAGIVLGLQQRFDWNGVVASAVSAGVSEGLSERTLLKNSDKLVRSTLSQTGGRVVSTVSTGGRVTAESVVTDLFGNALASNLTLRNSSSATQSQRIAGIDRESEAVLPDVLAASERFASTTQSSSDEWAGDFIDLVVIVGKKTLTWGEQAWDSIVNGISSVGSYVARAFSSSGYNAQDKVANWDFHNSVQASRERLNRENTQSRQSYIYNTPKPGANSWDKQVARGLHAPLVMAMQSGYDIRGGVDQIAQGNIGAGALQFGGGILGAVPNGGRVSGLRGLRSSSSSLIENAVPAWKLSRAGLMPQRTGSSQLALDFGVSTTGAYSQRLGVTPLIADFGIPTSYSAGSVRLLGTNNFIPAARTGLSYETTVVQQGDAIEIALLSRQKFDKSTGAVVASFGARSDLLSSFNPASGDLFIKWYETSISGRGVGSEMISKAIETAGARNVTSVSAQLGLLNLKAYEAARITGASSTTAVWQTPIGKSMQSMGFPNVVHTGNNYVKFYR